MKTPTCKRTSFVAAARQSAALFPTGSHRSFARRRYAILALLLGFILPAAAQSYSVTSHRIAGGGGTSTNGPFSVSGTLGQHDAGGAMTNGQYSASGGFWVLPVAVQTQGAPQLTIVPAAPGQGTISWTPATPGFVLQETPGLAPSNWVNSASGVTNPVTVPATGPSKFYRLHKP